MIGGALASWLTASIAGIMISVPEVTTPEAFKDFTSKIVVKDEDGNDIINDTMSISFIYNHADSKDGVHMVTVRLGVIDKQSGIKTSLIGECVFRGDSDGFLMSDPCIFKKEKTLYDNSSYTIELSYTRDGYGEGYDYSNKIKKWYWKIVSFKENQNTIKPITPRIGEDYFFEPEPRGGEDGEE